MKTGTTNDNNTQNNVTPEVIPTVSEENMSLYLNLSNTYSHFYYKKIKHEKAYFKVGKQLGSVSHQIRDPQGMQD